MRSETYTWIFLPGDTTPTLCGRYSHEVTAAGKGVGTFVYGQSYLRRRHALALDPVLLPLVEREFTTTEQGGVFGVLLDAMPDDWGRYVIERRHGPQTFPMGYLLKSQEDRVGNLAFSPSPDKPPAIRPPVNRSLLQLARRVIAGLEDGRPVPPDLEDVIRPNTAMGGARPKFTVEDGQAQWLAKFPSRRDDPEIPIARVEAAMLELARACKINAASAEVEHVDGDDILLVRRFDRTRVGERDGQALWCRDGFVSARTVFYSDPLVQQYSYSGSYPRLALELSRWSARPASDRYELFRRMVFNCVISNTDDHDRNHGFISADDAHLFRLAPAYDLVPVRHGTRRRHQQLGVGQEGSAATLNNVLSSVDAFGLSTEAAESIVHEMEECVLDNWRACLSRQGLEKKAADRLAGCFGGLPESYDRDAAR